MNTGRMRTATVPEKRNYANPNFRSVQILANYNRMDYRAAELNSAEKDVRIAGSFWELYVLDCERREYLWNREPVRRGLSAENIGVRLPSSDMRHVVKLDGTCLLREVSRLVGRLATSVECHIPSSQRTTWTGTETAFSTREGVAGSYYFVGLETAIGSPGYANLDLMLENSYDRGTTMGMFAMC